MKHTNIRKGNWVEVIQEDGQKAIGKVESAYITGDQLYFVIVNGSGKFYKGNQVIGKVKKPL